MSGKTGSSTNLGLYNIREDTPDSFPELIRTLSNAIVEAAGDALEATYNEFGLDYTVPAPVVEDDLTEYNHDIDLYDAFFFHSDHLGSSSYITNSKGIVTQHMEYLPFGELLVEEHLNGHNSPFKFNAKELDPETGNYYYGARYYSPKYNLMLSVDPLYEMYPGISPYAYVLNNPLRYTDPTGMAAENADDCGIGCGLRKVFNSVFHPNRSQLPDGRIERSGTKGGTSRATGWKFDDPAKKTDDKKEESSQSRPVQEAITSNLSIMGINPQTFIPQIDVQLPKLNPINRSSFRFDDTEIIITGRESQSVDFNFSTVGGVARNWDGRLSGGTNHILPMTNSQQQNLQAIANYLIANPQATVRFQYPTPGANFHPAAANDLREVYQMNFSQMTNYLIQQGVTDPNRRVLMNYGTGFDFIVNPGN